METRLFKMSHVRNMCVAPSERKSESVTRFHVIISCLSRELKLSVYI
jgi:hypothetical protein